MNRDPNLSREDRVLRRYAMFGFEWFDATKPRHHGWGSKSQKKVRRERRQRGGAK